MTKSYHCPFCSIRTLDNTILATSGKHILRCPQCNLEIEYSIITEPNRTFTAIQKEFVKTPLTPFQEFGSTTKKWRKKKN